MPAGLIEERGLGFTRQTAKSGAAITWNVFEGAVDSANLTQNTALTIMNVVPGIAGIYSFIQDATGGRTVTAVNWIHADQHTPDLAPNAVSDYQLYCRADGTILLSRLNPSICEDPLIDAFDRTAHTLNNIDFSATVRNAPGNNQAQIIVNLYSQTGTVQNTAVDTLEGTQTTAFLAASATQTVTFTGIDGVNGATPKTFYVTATAQC